MRTGVGHDYDLVQRHLDPLHYLLQTPRLLDRPRVDLVEHFLEYGVQHLRSPEIHFSMADYLERHPERAEGSDRNPYVAWLEEGRAAGEIADPAPAIPEMAHILGLDPRQVVELLVDRRADVVQRVRTGELGEMIERATEIEPLIGQARTRFTRPRLLPFGDPTAVAQVSLIHRVHEVCGWRPARLVLVINRPRWGGGRRLEGHLAHALVPGIAAEDVVVIYTDGGGPTPVDRYPHGVREVDFAGLTEGFEPEAAEAALVVLLRTFRADAIVNINSATLYRAMRSFGRALTASERVFLTFFCNERTPFGSWTGWSLRYFYRLYEQVEGVITDSHSLAQDLVSTYHLPEARWDRLHVLSAPVDPKLPFVAEAPAAPGRRPQVFWAGRWDRQKRMGLVLDVARAMPDVDFRLWGEQVMGGHHRRVPPNVTMEGRYGHISEVPLHDADAWLYTSGWDGVPSQLLEVAVTGVPLVGTLVGGTGEVLVDGESWPVDQHAGAEAYVAALREVLEDPAGARDRARSLRDRLLAERTEEAFTERATTILLHSRHDNQSEDA
jgi:glycosyltransferase involved in cell wall biosynthesis